MELSESAIIGGIIPNIAVFILFCLLIIYFREQAEWQICLDGTRTIKILENLLS